MRIGFILRFRGGAGGFWLGAWGEAAIRRGGRGLGLAFLVSLLAFRLVVVWVVFMRVNAYGAVMLIRLFVTSPL